MHKDFKNQNGEIPSSSTIARKTGSLTLAIKLAEIPDKIQRKSVGLK